MNPSSSGRRNPVVARVGLTFIFCVPEDLVKKTAVILLLAALAVTMPASAQSRFVDVIGRASWVDLGASDAFEGGGFDESEIEFDSEIGYGAAVNFFLGNRISLELGASIFEPETTLTSNNPTVPFLTRGTLEMIPITGVLQFHFAPASRFDPYIGAGAAYVLFDELNNTDDLDQVQFERLDFEDNVGLAVNAGVNIGFGANFALNLDAKYVPVESSAEAVFVIGPNSTAEVAVNPLIVSAGLALRF